MQIMTVLKPEARVVMMKLIRQEKPVTLDGLFLPVTTTLIENTILQQENLVLHLILKSQSIIHETIQGCMICHRRNQHSSGILMVNQKNFRRLVLVDEPQWLVRFIIAICILKQAGILIITITNFLFMNG